MISRFLTIIKSYWDVDIPKTIFFNHFSKKVRRINGGRLLIFKNSSIVLGKCAEIQVVGPGDFSFGMVPLRRKGSCSNIRVGNGGLLSLGGMSSFCDGGNIYVAPNSKMKIGRNCYIEKNGSFHSAGHFEFGADSICGPNCTLRTPDSHKINGKRKMKDVIVGNHVFLGGGVTLIGSSVGNGSVIGACSLIVNDIPDNCVSYGIPAVVKKTGVTWEF